MVAAAENEKESGWISGFVALAEPRGKLRWAYYWEGWFESSRKVSIYNSSVGDHEWESFDGQGVGMQKVVVYYIKMVGWVFV
jgi:hypothetical protein